MSKNTNDLKFVVSTIGDPTSASTYSGVPYQLFKAMDKASLIDERINGYDIKKLDYFSGYFDIKKSLSKMKPYRNAVWRYRKETRRKLSARIDEKLANKEFDVFFQIGCGGLPSRDCIKIAHIEIPISQAMSDEVYAKSYGFYDIPQKIVNDALSGEREFLEQCNLIWTNTQWTANALRNLGLPDDKILVFPPCINVSDNKPYRELNLSEPRILFIGKDWERKGGPELVAAFELLINKYPNAKLHIIGCSPQINQENVTIHGFIDKSSKAGQEKLNQIISESNIFCMPSRWESTGIVYFEAMENSLPVVMVKGQGREDLFGEFCTILDDSHPSHIANAVEGLIENKEITSRMTLEAFNVVNNLYNYDQLIKIITQRIQELS